MTSCLPFEKLGASNLLRTMRIIHTSHRACGSQVFFASGAALTLMCQERVSRGKEETIEET